jgi:probable phosphoglycerate mutase
VVAHGVVCKVLILCLLPDRGVASWQALGKVENLAFSELRFDGTNWQPTRLLEIPPPVAALQIIAENPTIERSQG